MVPNTGAGASSRDAIVDGAGQVNHPGRHALWLALWSIAQRWPLGVRTKALQATSWHRPRLQTQKVSNRARRILFTLAAGPDAIKEKLIFELRVTVAISSARFFDMKVFDILAAIWLVPPPMVGATSVVG